MATVTLELNDKFFTQLDATAKARGVSVQSLILAALVDQPVTATLTAAPAPGAGPARLDAFRARR
ncbi:hypothetical protein [Azospirillum sp. sgz301742]